MVQRVRNWIAVGVALILALTVFWWFPSAIKAVNLTIYNPNPITPQGWLYQFYVRMDLSTDIIPERIPITDLKLFIYDDTGEQVAWVKFDFYGNIIDGSEHFVNVEPIPSPEPGPGYGYGFDSGLLWGMGYGFQPHYAYDPRIGYYVYTPGNGYGLLFDCELLQE